MPGGIKFFLSKIAQVRNKNQWKKNVKKAFGVIINLQEIIKNKTKLRVIMLTKIVNASIQAFFSNEKSQK